MINQIIKYNMNKYNSLYSIKAPSSLTYKRWKDMLDIYEPINFISKKYKITPLEVINIINKMDIEIMELIELDILDKIYIEDIAKIKSNPGKTIIDLNKANLIYNNRELELISIERSIIMNELKTEIKNNKYMIILDTETNSLPLKNRIDRGFPVQISYAIVNTLGDIISVRNLYLKPVYDLDDSAVNIHKLDYEFLNKNGIEPQEAYNIVKKDIELFNNPTFIIHNASFDIGVLERLGKYCKTDSYIQGKALCTLKYFKARKDLKNKKSNSLTNIQKYYNIEDSDVNNLVNKYFRQSDKESHNAMFDVMNLYKVITQQDVWKDILGCVQNE